MMVGVGYSDDPDSTEAGRIAAAEAISNAGRTDTCDLVLLFSTARHNLRLLREAVAVATGNSYRIYGGGAVGIITNNRFGYAGDQVGVACVWLEQSECTILIECGLLDSEVNTGLRLGKRLAAMDISPSSPVMLFYDAVDRTREPMRLLMATWILEGLQRGLGFLPDITGAGLLGDHICTPTGQFTGNDLSAHCALALVFSDDIHIDNVIMHGCKPASPYYTVTRAEGPEILEIDGKPALAFMDKLLGPAIRPEDYPFFLLFGINHSDTPGQSAEENYASRLCLSIDKERSSIIMFEPDMVAGTKFQLMYRSMGLDYMKPKIQALYDNLDGREPLFAVYIDCAGRCAGYGGTELEDAYVVQEAVGDRIPLLGLYTGVEIASIGGRPRGLDWTGVFCLFSQNGAAPQKNQTEALPIHRPEAGKKRKNTTLTPQDMRKLCEQNVAKVLELDARSIIIRYELEQKRRSLGLLTELAVSLRQGTSNESKFLTTARRLNATLNMQKTVVLLSDGRGHFVPSALQGYSSAEKAALEGRAFDVDKALLDIDNPVLVTGETVPGYLSDLRTSLGLPYLISLPVVTESSVTAILITGRTMEAPPFLSRLGTSDVETVQAICALLSSVLMHRRLDDVNRLAQTDELTGLLNRRALEMQASELLRAGYAHGNLFAFIMIDTDHFKQVNDTYGHLMGDEVLKALARTLRSVFRVTDLAARLGGDEFVLFCPLTTGVKSIEQRVRRLIWKWRRTPVMSTQGEAIHTTLSIGISIAPRDGATYNELFRMADIALYRSKASGRNRYTVYNKKTMKNNQLRV